MAGGYAARTLRVKLDLERRTSASAAIAGKLPLLMPSHAVRGEPQFDPDSLQSRIPTERPRDGSWLRRSVHTFVGVLGAPRVLLDRCPEPINHGAVLRFLATLRLVPWVALVVWLGASWLRSPGREVAPSRGIDVFLDPALRESLSMWMLLMVPVGMPLLYFVCGLVSHVAVGLTGGAARSVGASMRALGYAMAPALLGVGLLDVVIFTVGMPGVIYTWIALALLLPFLWVATFGLAATHQIHLVRAMLIALVPAVILFGVFVGRAMLQLEDTPWLPEPPSAYVVP